MLKILDDVCKPTKGSKYSAAIDLYAREDVVIGAGETVKVPLGVCIDLIKLIAKNRYANLHLKNIHTSLDDDNFLRSHYFQLEPRSSLRAKGLIAGTGIIDLDYKDEIMIILHNPFSYGDMVSYVKGKDSSDRSYSRYTIYKGDKIAQILLKEHKTYLIGIDTQEERTGGFGSTDK